MRKSYVISLLIALFLDQAAFAQTTTPNSNGTTAPTTTTPPTQPTTPATPGTTVTNQADGTQVTLQTVYCPDPSTLVKNGLFWGTPTGGWKSYSEAFDSSIAGFVGAQWVGVNVGKMICIYKGNLSMSFPITLQNDTLAQTPTGGLWGNDLGGYRNCHSATLTDCPFVVQTTSVNIQQIYQSLDFFKGKPNPLNQNGN